MKVGEGGPGAGGAGELIGREGGRGEGGGVDGNLDAAVGAAFPIVTIYRRIYHIED
jgi:hypothetical protein